MPKHARFAHCGRLERGADCAFNEQALYGVLLVVFFVTTFLFLFQAWSVRKDARRAALGSGRSAVVTGPQLCLLLAAGSSFCVFLDSFIMLGDLTNGTDNDHRFSFFGSILLFIALLLFANRWCRVVISLDERLGAGQVQHGDHSRKQHLHRAMRVIQGGYCCLAILHIPFVVMRVTQSPNHDLSVKLFAWCLVVESVVLSLLAILMCWIAFKMRLSNTAEGKTKDHIHQLCWVTLLNLAEQLIYDCAMIGVYRLYFSDGYMHYGNIQAAYFSLWFTVYWGMHVQLLLFFRFVTFSDEGKIGLLSDDFETQKQQTSGIDDEMFAGMPTSQMGMDLPDLQPASRPASKCEKTLPGLSHHDINIETDSEVVMNDSAFRNRDTTVRSTMLGSPVLEDAIPLAGVSNPLASF